MIIIRLCLIYGIFFDDLDLQIVEGNLFYERSATKPCLGGSLEILDIIVQPYGHGKVQGGTGFFERIKDLVGSGIRCIVFNDDVSKHMGFFKFSDPESEHSFPRKMTEMVINYTYAL